MAKRRRKIIRDLEADSKKAPARRAHIEAGVTGLYPLDAPGMPLPGPDFVDYASRLGDDTAINSVKVDGKTVKQLELGDKLVEIHRRALREPGFSMPIEYRAGQRKQVTFVPGHIWGQNIKAYEYGNESAGVDGPRPADVMVIGKMPGLTEEQEGRCLVGESGRLLIEILRELHVRGTPNWYVTNLCKFRPPDDSGTLKAGWIKDCMPLLHQELRIVRPKYILCLGADASKALLGKKASVTHMDGRVAEIEFPLHTKATDDPDEEVYHKAMVMTVVHPASVARAPETRRQLERGLARFDMLQRGIRWDKAEDDIDHRSIRTLEQLDALLEEIEADPDTRSRWVGVDAEWHGEHPVNKGSYVRTIQFAWKPKHACAVVLRGPGGKLTFVDKHGKPAIRRAISRLKKYFRNKRVVGHFFVADLEWLVHMGLDIRDQFYVPVYDKDYDDLPRGLQRRVEGLGFGPGDTVPAWVLTKWVGGADTGLMGHAIEETAMLALESLTVRYTTCPRYDIPLHNWKTEYCKEHGLKAKDLEGYGECPDEILVPYGVYDADATLRLFHELNPLVDCDYEGNCCREPFWEAMITTLPILEMHMTGFSAAKPRIDYLTKVFMKAKEKQEDKIQTWAKWPDFNVRSVQQVREFLFGTQLNGKRDKETGEPVRIRPEGAKSLALEPLLDTSKPPKQWADIKERKAEHEHSPSTAKNVLGVLAQENIEQADQVNMIRDYRFLDQVLKSLLRPPVTDDDGNWVVEDTGGEVDNLGGLVFDAGLASVICDDGRVRTHLYPTTETGRWRSARPNLQNISKRRDPDYERILGKDVYKYKLRSVLRASPGHVLIEADYIGAELYGMAIMSGDMTMIEHAKRNQLPEDHSDFYDIHSNVAKLAFHLDCAPTKSALKAAGKSHLRIVAKTVIFGIAYGRGAKAIALEAKQEGIEITVDEAQGVIDTIFEMYPGLRPFFEECRQRALNEGWLCNCFGRFRRFPKTDDWKLHGEFERQAMNYPIQSMIASVVDRAVAYIYDYKRDNPGLFRMLLQIHDAVLLEVPYEHVATVLDKVLPTCMVKMCPIYPTGLDGVPTGDGPYYLGIDSEVMVHWGERITMKQADQWGIPYTTPGGVDIVDPKEIAKAAA